MEFKIWELQVSACFLKLSILTWPALSLADKVTIGARRVSEFVGRHGTWEVRAGFIIEKWYDIVSDAVRQYCER